ncbi:MAG: hypothetical protein RDU59_02765 [Thermodesulfobacteriota bacterium]|nr:hypothetical protein [Thermodesulfobacteriota bacterium]
MRLMLSGIFAIVFSRLFSFLRKGPWAVVGMTAALLGLVYLLDYARKGKDK